MDNEPTLHDVHTRLAVLEATSKDRFDSLDKQLGTVDSKLDALVETQSSQRAQIAKHSGFIAMIVSVIVAVFTELFRAK